MMDKPLCQQLETELKTVIQNHLTTLAEFATPIHTMDVTLCKTIQHDLWILDELCQPTDVEPGKDVYSMVSESFSRICSLMQLINLTTNSSVFQNTELAHLWQRASRWCERFSTHYELSCEEVWDLIAPVVPDVLQKIGNNIYEAIWWKSAPRMDIEILQRTEYIVVENPPFEAANAPGGIAVRFTIHR